MLCRVNSISVSFIPNKETIEAIKEMDDIVSGRVQSKRYSSAEELFNDIDE